MTAMASIACEDTSALSNATVAKLTRPSLGTSGFRKLFMHVAEAFVCFLCRRFNMPQMGNESDNHRQKAKHLHDTSNATTPPSSCVYALMQCLSACPTCSTTNHQVAMCMCTIQSRKPGVPHVVCLDSMYSMPINNISYLDISRPIYGYNTKGEQTSYLQ